jgi:hypothetical protein
MNDVQMQRDLLCSITFTYTQQDWPTGCTSGEVEVMVSGVVNDLHQGNEMTRRLPRVARCEKSKSTLNLVYLRTNFLLASIFSFHIS